MNSAAQRAPNPVPPGDPQHDPQGERAHNIAQLLANHPHDWTPREQRYLIDMCASDSPASRAEITERMRAHGAHGAPARRRYY